MSAKWQTKRLTDVCSLDRSQGIHRGLPYVGLEHIESQTGRFIGALDPVEVKSSTFAFNPGHLLYGRLRPYLNKVLLPDFSGHCSTEIFPIKPKPNVSREFLWYWFSSDDTIQKVNATCTGARMPRANMDKVLEFDFLLPPLSEQNRIVAILDKAFAAIATATDNTNKNLLNSRTLLESQVQKVCTQRTNDWDNKTLGDVCQLFQGLCINAKTKHLLVTKSSLPLLRIKDLRDNSAEQFVAESGWPENAKVEESDIIYTRTGQIGLVFRGRNGVLHNNCFKVVPSSVLDKNYLFWWLQNPTFRERITTLASKAAQADITHYLFKAQPIDVPPMEYQVKGARAIDKTHHDTGQLIAVANHKLHALRELKESLLRQAFLGAL